MCNVQLKIANYILHRSNLKNPTFDRTRFGCQIFEIRRTADRMSNIWRMADLMSKIRYPKKCISDVEYSKFDGGQYRIGNRIESFCTLINRMLRRSWGCAPVRYCFHAGEPVKHPQANFLHYIISYTVSVTALYIYRVGTVIVKLQVTMPELQLV